MEISRLDKSVGTLQFEKSSSSPDSPTTRCISSANAAKRTSSSSTSVGPLPNLTYGNLKADLEWVAKYSSES